MTIRFYFSECQTIEPISRRICHAIKYSFVDMLFEANIIKLISRMETL